jgi:hypothetical protein
VKKLLISCMVILVFAAVSAWADPIELRITNGLNVVTVQDLDNDGVVNYYGAVGQWKINVTTGIGPGAPATYYMDLNSTDVSANSTPGTLVLEFSSKNNYPSAPMFDIGFGGTVANASAVYDVYYDNGNAFFQKTTLIASLGPYTGPFAGTLDGVPAAAAAMYSLTQVITITPNGHGLAQYSGDATIDPIPEPATLIFLGSGIALLSLVGRKLKA